MINKKALPRLKKKYEEEILKLLSEELGVENKLALPKVTKIVINVGVGEGIKNKDFLAQVKDDLSRITGQVPSVRRAKISVASFGVRRGMAVGLKVTLRGDKMYTFLDKLFSIVLPRLRDFRGVSQKSFDKEGNYTLGFEDYTVFPEVDLAKSHPGGLEISIVTSSRDVKNSKRLLELMGMPFEKI